MAQNSPTILAASLDDSQMKQSIANLVASVKRATHTMTTDFDNAVDHINKKLKELGDGKTTPSVKSGSANATSTKSDTQAVEENTAARKKNVQAIKEQALTFDQMAQAQQKAAAPKSARESYLAFMKGYKEQAQHLAQMIANAENALNTAVAKRADRLNQQLDAAKRKLHELQSMKTIQESYDGSGLRTNVRKLDPQIEQQMHRIAEVQEQINRLSANMVRPDLVQRINELYVEYSRISNIMKEVVVSSQKQETIQSRVSAEITKQIQSVSSAKTAREAFANVISMPSGDFNQAKTQMEALAALKEKISFIPALPKKSQFIADIEGAINRLKLNYEQFSETAVSAVKKTENETKNLTEQTKKASVELSENMKKASQAVRETFANDPKNVKVKLGLDNGGVGYIYRENDARSKGLSIEQQIAQLYADQARSQQQATAQKESSLRTEQQITEEVKKRKAYQSPTLREPEYYRAAVAGTANKLGIKESEVVLGDATVNSINGLSKALKQAQEAYAKLSAEERNAPIGKAMRQRLQEIEHDLQKTRKEMSRPIDLKSALSGSEKTLDDIAYKMQRLRAYKQGIDPVRRGTDTEIRQINNELVRLQKTADNWMGKQQEMIKGNTALGRSWNYMKNRLAFYLTVGATTQFARQLVDIRSQYEMNERALGILIDSAERGTRIFNELSQMSLVSPYTLIELTTAAKQLSAYDIAAKDVVDTTRRLADMASAVGIPIERLTYALGQIKAYGYLNSRDARMFSNAGIPLVKQLSEYYTQLEGRLVSTADVYDRIKKKTVDFEEVVNVIHHMTDEGGKFFDFQAKMADTLKVRLANLQLAWNNMLNDIGEESEGVIRGSIGVLRDLFANWKDIKHYVEEAVVAFGAYKVAQLLIVQTTGVAARSMTSEILAMKRTEVELLRKKALTQELTASEKAMIATSKVATATDYQNALSTKNLTKQKALLLAAFNMNNKKMLEALIRMGLLTSAEIRSMTVGKAMTLVFKSMGLAISSAARAIGAFLASNWVFILLGAAFELYHAFDSASEHIKDINKGLIEDAKNTYKDLKDFLESVEPIRIKIKAGKLEDSEAQKAWDDLRERLETLSANSAIYISKLMGQADMTQRLKEGYEYAEMLQKVQGVIEGFGDEDIKGTETIWGGLFGEGLKDDIKDFLDVADELVKEYGSIGDAQEELSRRIAAGQGVGGALADLYEMNKEVKESVNSIIDKSIKENLNIDEQRELFEKAIKKIATESKLSATETRVFRINSEKLYFKELEEMYIKDTRHRYNIDIEGAEREFAADKALQQEFFTWLSEVHSSETQKRISNASEEEIKNGEWLTKENKRWIQERAKEFSDKYKVSFSELNSLVQQANTWSIYIPVYFQTAKDSLSEFQKDFYKRAKETFKQDQATAKQVFAGILPEKDDTFPKWVKARQDEIKQLGEDRKKYERDETEWSKQHVRDIDEQIKHNKQALDLYHQPYEEDKKNKKKGKDEILEALKLEISLVDKLNADYDRLTKAGASREGALAKIRSAYGKTIKELNAQLGRFGLPKLDITKILLGEDPSKQLEHFRNTLNSLVKRGLLNMERAKEVEAIIEKLEVSAETYNLTKITKGIENELGKLKEKYELAIELDANPEEGEIFADFMRLDKKELAKLPRSFEQLMSELQNVVDEKLAGKDLKFDLSEMINKKNFEKWVEETGHTLEDGMIKSLDAVREYAVNVLKDETKQLGELVSKYGEAAAKIEKIYQSNTRKVLSVISTYGDNTQKKAGLNLANQLSITSDSATVSRLREELKALAEEVADKSEGYSAQNLLDAIFKNEKESVAKTLWEGFKSGDYYSVVFDDISRASTTALQIMKAQLDGLKDKVKESPESMKALMSAYSKLREELIARDPFIGIAEGLNNMKAAHQQTIIATAELGEAEKELKRKEESLDALRRKEPHNIVAIYRAEKELGKAKKKVAAASANVTKSQNNETASTEDYEKAVKKANEVIKKLANSFKEIGSTLDNTTGDVIKFIGNIFNYVTFVSDSMMSVSQTASKAIQAIEKASVILAIISAAIQLIQELNSLIPDSFDQYEKAAKKQAEINKLKDAVVQYRLAVLAARMEEENWFSENSMKKLKNFYKVGSEALDAYNEKLLQEQAIYENEQSGGWLTKFAYWTNPATWIKEITGIESDWADAIAMVGSGLFGMEAQMGQLGIWLTQHGNDDVYDYAEGYTAAINNLRIETKGRSKGFLGTGIGGHAQETEDLIKWVKENLKLKLFDEDLMLNEEAYQVLMDNYADKLVGETKATLEALHELTEKWNEYVEQLNEYVDSMYSPLVSNMTDALWSWYDEGKSALDSFKEYASDTFRDIVTDMVKTIILENFAEKYADDVKKMYQKYSKGGMSEENLIRSVAERTGQMMEEFDANMPILENLMNTAGEVLEKYGIILRKGDLGLDNLQQGISSVTEDTALALEAYMNSISQQVYLHSELLTEIRDAVVSFDHDALLATTSQILLQLQSSYQVQMTIQGTLEGWSTPSGQAVRVEMVS